jgi:lipoprotein-releasing system permease protein
MIKEFELFVASRYLRAKRKQAVISVITIISVIGVAAGVMALVIALGINNGFRGTLQRNLLSATAHVSVLEKKQDEGIKNWRELTEQFRKLPHVTAAMPSLYGHVVISGMQPSAAILKGVESSRDQAEILSKLKQGSVDRLMEKSALPGIILGSRLAENAGMMFNSIVTVVGRELTPLGPRTSEYRFRVVGIFESGFYELDSLWAYSTLANVQMVLSVPDVVNSIEIRVDDIYRAPEIARAAEQVAGPALAATHWMEMNKSVLGALRMERVVTVVTIGLIQIVAALNILVALIMMVMEKYKDIAILMSMGAKHQQIRRIFMLQGALIGVVGSVLGLIVGYSICYFANKYRWISLPADVYSLSFVPFEPRGIDGVWIAAVAILVSFVATLYPARNATRIVPVEALRYE